MKDVMPDLQAYIRKQSEWSVKTFGGGLRTKGLIEHIVEELGEIEENPGDVFEWVDVIILALDGAWRTGHTAEEICEALAHKQQTNFARKWAPAGAGKSFSRHVEEVPDV